MSMVFLAFGVVLGACAMIARAVIDGVSRIVIFLDGDDR